jgi:hypothetical protein
MAVRDKTFDNVGHVFEPAAVTFAFFFVTSNTEEGWLKFSLRIRRSRLQTMAHRPTMLSEVFRASTQAL